MISLRLQLIEDFLNTSYTERMGAEPSEDVLRMLWSLSVAIYLVGGCIGAFAVGKLANGLGR